MTNVEKFIFKVDVYGCVSIIDAYSGHHMKLFIHRLLKVMEGNMNWIRNIDKRVWYVVWVVMGVCAISYSLHLDDAVNETLEKNNRSYIILDDEVYEIDDNAGG